MWTDNTEVDYTYDVLGRLSTVKEVKRAGTTLPDPQVTAYVYDAVGNVSTITVTQGTATLRQTTNHYNDQRHWLDNIENEDGAGITLSTFTYTRRPDGQIVQVDENVKQPDSTFVDTTTIYSYDALNRLTQESVDTSTPGGDYTKAYTLDLVGNRVKLVTTLEGQASTETDSTYNARDELLTETTAGVTTEYSYDSDGSLKTKTVGSETDLYDWDVRGRLSGATVTQNGTPTATSSYRYTPDGTRSSATANGVTTAYIVDALSPSGYPQVIEERTAAGVMVGSYVYGLGLDPISQWKQDQGSGLFLPDGHSGSRQVIDPASGAVILTQRFDAFGVAMATAGTFVTAIGYRGGRLDAATGWYDDRARPYDPRIGRFPAQDPFTRNYNDPSQVMRYGYTGGNPIGLDDPSGLWPGLPKDGPEMQAAWSRAHRFLELATLAQSPTARIEPTLNSLEANVNRLVGGEHPDVVDGASIYDFRYIDLPGYLGGTPETREKLREKYDEVVRYTGHLNLAAGYIKYTPGATLFNPGTPPYNLTPYPQAGLFIIQGKKYFLASYNDYNRAGGVVMYDFIPYDRTERERELNKSRDLFTGDEAELAIEQTLWIYAAVGLAVTGVLIVAASRGYRASVPGRGVTVPSGAPAYVPGPGFGAPIAFSVLIGGGIALGAF